MSGDFADARCYQMPSDYTWVPCLNCGVDEIGGVAIYRLFGNFSVLIRTVSCMVLKAKANDKRTSSPLPR
ncbi:hypothetical protein TNCV_679681 [Trichonephila clavipes]|nr:hypothetical protein TNCV_679681 [Trichonephila clavipes]